MDDFVTLLGGRLIGARVVDVQPYDGPMVKVEFEFRGTDEGAGYLLVSPSLVHFSADAEFSEG